MNTPVGVSSPGISRATIFEHARKLPAAPQVLAGLCELLQDVNTDLAQIAEEIRFEPTLTVRIIRMSNSAVFGGGRRVGSVDEAVNRVGFAEVLRLVGAATVAGLVDRSLGCYNIGAEQLRESLLLHALASEILAGRSGVDGRIAYTAGLLRGLGMMVLDRAGRTTIAPTDAYDIRRFPTYGEWERAHFATEGGEVTTIIMTEWQFPPEIVAALQGHLLRRESDYKDRFACVLNLAGAIVAEQGRALPGETDCWQLTPEKLAGAGLDEEQFRAAAVEATALFERQRAALY